MLRGRIPPVLRWPALALVVAFVAIQLVPYGWSHPNPPVVEDAPWPSPMEEAGEDGDSGRGRGRGRGRGASGPG